MTVPSFLDKIVQFVPLLLILSNKNLSEGLGKLEDNNIKYIFEYLKGVKANKKLIYQNVRIYKMVICTAGWLARLMLMKGHFTQQ